MVASQKYYTWKKVLSSLEGDRILAGIGGTGLLCTPLVGDPGMAKGGVMGQVFWFHLVMLLMAASACWGMCKKQARFRFQTADALVIAFTLITLLTYDWQLNPAPEKLFFGGQLLALWLLLRQRLEGDAELRFYFLLVLLVIGTIEAIWGIRQLQGETVSNHTLFRLTGSFYNPGPYSGFLAMVLPIGLWIVLTFQKLTSYIGWLCVGIILIVLPAGMSRTAWIAAAIACGWVYWMEGISQQQKETLYIRYERHALLYTMGILLLAGGSAILLYGMKRESAEGRLLLWKVTAQAIAEQPLTGTGLGGFPAAFAEAQSQYFSSGNATEEEKWVAGCPAYAFNEYLQIGLEQGILGLLLFIGWLVAVCRQGFRCAEIGAIGAIIAWMLFAFASYPLQLPSFPIALLFLGAICMQDEEKKRLELEWEKSYAHAPFTLTLTFLIVLLFLLQRGLYIPYKQWGRLETLYQNRAYRSIADDYAHWHFLLKHRAEYLFQEAQCLSKDHRERQAVQVLERAKRLSADPMIRYMLAKNLQQLGKYPEAEQELLHAIEILPERIYPYYLLAKLYAEPAFCQPEKFRQAAELVMQKKAKVETSATREMRKEIKKLYICNINKK